MPVSPSKADELNASRDMEPVAGTVDLDVPVEKVWEAFSHPRNWSQWNPCFFWAYNDKLELGQRLVWVFQPIKKWMLYKMPAVALIVELEEGRKVTWEVTILPGFYARHTYHMEDLGNGLTRFGSWEKACGWSFRLLSWFWIAHFTFVKDASLAGAKRFEEEFHRTANPQG